MINLPLITLVIKEIETSNTGVTITGIHAIGKMAAIYYSFKGYEFTAILIKGIQEVYCFHHNRYIELYKPENLNTDQIINESFKRFIYPMQIEYIEIN